MIITLMVITIGALLQDLDRGMWRTTYPTILGEIGNGFTTLGCISLVIQVAKVVSTIW